MKISLQASIIVLLIFCATQSFARLEFDSAANKIELYGPYIKYNTLKEPFSLGQFEIDLSDIRLEMDGENKLNAVWPRFLLSFGSLQIITKDGGRILLNEALIENELKGDDKYFRYPLNDQSSSLQEALAQDFQVCVEQMFNAAKVRACSDYFKLVSGVSTKTHTGANASAVSFNKQKSPKNAQISLSKDQKTIDFEIKFKSGFIISIRDTVRHLGLENIVIDPSEKRLGILDGTGAIRPTQITLKDRLFSFIKEKNDFKNQYEATKMWPQDLEDAEMEFAPYQLGASLQLYGLILPKVPPPFEFKLDDKMPIATYKKTVELTGTKGENEVLAAKNQNELFIHNNQKEFLWKFPATTKGQVNQNYLSLQHKNKDFFFSQRIFRAHQTAIAGAFGLSTSTTLDIVPGYNLSAEHWFEEIWNKSKYSFQRWGVAFNIYETIQGFKPKKDFPEKISINPIHLDLLYRLNQGVRPVQSSFGLGLRYQNFTLFRSVSPDIQTQLLGIGGFWHTAPQKIVDDIFNIIPLFRYPKWMEVSFFYYPFSFSDVSLGFSFSWQLKGKMFFAKSWYLEAAFNVNSVSFTQPTSIGTTDQFGIATAHGTVGLGYLF